LKSALYALFRRIFPGEVAIHIFLVAFRAVTVGKSGFGMNLDVVFDPLPIVFPVANFFATAANR
jgi:hypothetical protein